MSKVLMIGIDSLDPNLLLKFKDVLPNFNELMDKSPAFKSSSIFPPDTIPAWTTIFTGLNPARHGLVYTYDVFGMDKENISKVDTSVFKDKTFWDFASKNGKKVCVLFPHLIHPPWPVNGTMVTRAEEETKIEGLPPWIVEREIKSFPKLVMEEYNIPNSMRVVAGTPPSPKDLKKFIEQSKKATIQEAEIGLKVLKESKWDLFFIYFSWLDIIQHFFWRYFDENDPTHPSDSEYRNVIMEFYKFMDEIVGRFIHSFTNATTIVLSDHGHEMRPTKTVNLNEFLRKKNLLFEKNNTFKQTYLTEKIKKKLLDFAHDHELDYWLVKIGTTKILSPLSKKVYMSSSTIDSKKSLAYLSAFIGSKSYRQGGISINKNNLKGVSYEEFRDLLIKELIELKHPETGEGLVSWACEREELYSGEYITKYPDIVFELEYGYGVYWAIHTSLIGRAYEHTISSGAHAKEGVFLISNLDDKEEVIKNMTLMDVAPTILDLLGIDGRRFNFDGRRIWEKNN